MKTLNITESENGFIVHENSQVSTYGKQWSFESVKSLSDFIIDWGQEVNKQKPEKINNQSDKTSELEKANPKKFRVNMLNSTMNRPLDLNK